MRNFNSSPSPSLQVAMGYHARTSRLVWMASYLVALPFAHVLLWFSRLTNSSYPFVNSDMSAGGLAAGFADHIVGVLVVVFIFAALIGVIVAQIQTTLVASNAVKTAWNFTGATAAQTLFGLTPLFIVIGFVLLVIGIALGKVRI